MLTFPFFEKIRSLAEGWMEEAKTLFFLFHREKVFRYVLLLAALMLAAGGLFMAFEAD